MNNWSVMQKNPIDCLAKRDNVTVKENGTNYLSYKIITLTTYAKKG